MKRIVLLFLAFMTSLYVMGCSDSPTDDGGNTGNGTMSAKVDGTNWKPNYVQATYANNAFGIGGAAIAGSTNHQINISGMVTGAGTYQLGPLTGVIATYAEGSSSGGISVTPFAIKSGTLVIDQIDAGGAKGSFSFTAQESGSSGPGRTVSITEGTFDVTF